MNTLQPNPINKLNSRALYISTPIFIQSHNRITMSTKLFRRISRIAFTALLLFLLASLKSSGQTLTPIKYGRLYNFYAVADTRGLAPEGWHIPTDDEWTALIDSLGGSVAAGSKLKETGTNFWYSPNADATNESGFAAYPGGCRDYTGYFYQFGSNGHWWGSTTETSTYSMSRTLWSYYIDNVSSSDVSRSWFHKKGGLSIRCVKDDSTDTGTVTDIDGNVYPTVKIYNQVWMARNLVVTRYRNGDPIPNVSNNTSWSNLNTGAWCVYGNDYDNVLVYTQPTVAGSYEQTQSPKLCQAGKISVTITNSSTDIYSVATSVIPTITYTGMTIQKVQIWDNSTNAYIGNLPFTLNNNTITITSLTTDLDGNGGFSDINSDGKFDDLAAGASVKFEITYNLDNSNPTYSENYSRSISLTGNVSYKSCGTTSSIELFGWNASESGTSTAVTPALLTSGQPQQFQFSPSIQMTNFPCDGDEFSCSTGNLVEIDLPLGIIPATNPNPTYTPDGSSTSQTVTATYNSTTRLVSITGGGGKGTYSISLDLNCNVGAVSGLKTINWRFKRVRNIDSNTVTSVILGSTRSVTIQHCGVEPTLTPIRYGRLYNWYAVNDSRGLAPAGWHIPTDTEWTALTDYLGGSIAGASKMKEAGTDHWYNPNTDATNESGFSAYAGGCRDYTGLFYFFNGYGFWWSSTGETSSTYSIGRQLISYYIDGVASSNLNGPWLRVKSGLSIRCVKDDSTDTGTVTDIDGNVYPTVKIGKQVWIARNLIVTRYRNGDSIPNITNNSAWAALTTGARCAYNNDENNVRQLTPIITQQPKDSTVYARNSVSFNVVATDAITYQWQTSADGINDWTDISDANATTYTIPNAAKAMDGYYYRCSVSNTYGATLSESAKLTVVYPVKYGYLYNWYAVNDTRGLAPEGWHIPSYSEWVALSNNLGGGVVSGNKLREAGTDNWVGGAGTNESGFTALPGGERTEGGSFIYQYSYTLYWTSNNIERPFAEVISANSGGINGIGMQDFSMKQGNSIRCIKDDSSDPGIVKDIDGNIYPTVKIGNQVWMAQNLVVTKYKDGTPIPCVTTNASWAALTTGARCAYNNDECNVFESLPSITIQPANPNVFEGDSVTFTITTPEANLNYQWLQSTSEEGEYTPISGANTSSYTIGSVTASMDKTYYKCRISNTTCPTTYKLSQFAILQVYNSDKIVHSQPISSIIKLGEQATYSIECDTRATNLQWQRKKNTESEFTDISGETNTTLTFTTTEDLNYAQFRCKFSINGIVYYSQVATLTLILPYAEPELSNLNYIYTIAPLVPIKNLSELSSKTMKDVGEQVKYFDGLGRPSQTVAIRTTPSYKDLVQPVVYDDYGRESEKYLPYEDKEGSSGSFRGDTQWSTRQTAYYNANFDSEGAFAKTKINYEESPLNRVLSQQGVGADWVNKEASYIYGTNSSTDVKYFSVASDNSLVLNGNYDEGTLNLLETKDEDNRVVQEWKDLAGQVVLKRSYTDLNKTGDVAETYYVYDDLGRLRYVLPPKMIENLESTTSFAPTAQLVTDLCFYYLYDERGRVIEKQIPGADPVFMVYDLLDRPVLTQDGEQRKDSLWIANTYDAFGRTLKSGLVTITGVANTQDAAQTWFNSNPNSLDESISSSTGVLLVQNWYDTYDGLPSGFESISYTKRTNLSMPDDPSSRTRGMLTAQEIRVLNPEANKPTTLKSKTFYDKDGRTLQTISQSYEGGYLYQSYKYEWSGKVLNEELIIDQPTSVTLERGMTYDQAGRVILIQQRVDGGTWASVAANEYDALGKNTTRRLGLNGSNRVQDLNYKYNIRGWLTDINNPDDIGRNLFAMRLNYQKRVLPDVQNETSEAQYTGNISEEDWVYRLNSTSSTNTPSRMANRYSYDGLNRLTDSYGYSKGLSNWTRETEKYDTKYQYDVNGNLSTLQRYGISETGNQLIDNLSYTYKSNQKSNQLETVTDQSTKSEGYTDTNTSGVDFTYSGNGSMVTDLDKGINVTYNYLNLPQRVEERKINNKLSVNYVYTATGQKLAALYLNGSTLMGGNRYIGSMVYTYSTATSSWSPEYISTAEGRLTYKGSAWVPRYFLTDHLGNIRSIAERNTEFKEETGWAKQVWQQNYYPFGMTLGQPYVLENNQLGYNGKEKQDFSLNGHSLDWLDYGARFYDPQIGRWTTVDPHAEKYRRWAPYAYCVDNPLRFIDPDGMDVYKVDKDGNINLRRHTHKNYDKLVGSGRLFNRSIKVEKGTFEKNHGSGEVTNSLGDKSSYDTYSMNSTQGQNLFEFLSKNTNVEWGHWKLGEGGGQTSLLSTSHNSNADMSGLELLKNPLFASSITGHDHNHPHGSNIPSGSNMPLDMPEYRDGDVGFARSIENYVKRYNRNNQIIGGDDQRSLPVFRIYTAGDNNYTNYNGDTYIDDSIVVTPK